MTKKGKNQGSSDSSDSKKDAATKQEQTDDSDESSKLDPLDGWRTSSKTAKQQAEAEESDAIGNQVQDLREALGLERGRKIIGADYSDELEELGNKMLVAENKGIPLKEAGKITDADVTLFIKDQRFKRETDLLGIEDQSKLSKEAKDFIQNFIDNPKSVPTETRSTFLDDVVGLNGDLTKWKKPGDSTPPEPPTQAPGKVPSTVPETPLPATDTTPKDTEANEEAGDATAPAETQPATTDTQDTGTAEATAPAETQPATTDTQDTGTAEATAPAETQPATTDTQDTGTAEATAPAETQPATTDTQDTGTAEATEPGSSDSDPGGTYGSGSNKPQGGESEAPPDAGGDYYYSGWVNTDGGGHMEGYYYEKDGVWYNGDTGEVVTDSATIGSLNFVRDHNEQGQTQTDGAPPAGEAEGGETGGEGEPGGEGETEGGAEEDDDDDDDDDDGDDDDDDDDEEEEEQGEAGEDDVEEDDDDGGDAGEEGTPNPDASGASDWGRQRFYETPIGSEEKKREQDAIEQRKAGGFTDPADESRDSSPLTLDPRSGLIGVASGKQPGGGVTDPPDEPVDRLVVTTRDLDNLKMWSAGGPAADPPEDAPHSGPRPAIDPHAPIPQVPLGGPSPKGEVDDSVSDLVGASEQTSKSSTEVETSDDEVDDSASEADNDASDASGGSKGSGGSFDASESDARLDVSTISFETIDLHADVEIDVDEIEDVGNS